jgi:hypothetical protein
LHQFLLGLTGLMLLVAAIDIVWTHNISLDPERDETSGQRTPRGESRFRQDIIVGSSFIFVGGALVMIAVGGLIRPNPVAEVGEGGITLRIAGPNQRVLLGWPDVSEVRSGREPGDGTGFRPLLLVRLRYPDAWPKEYWGARRDGPWLIVDAESWNTPAEELVVHARLTMAAFERTLEPAEEQEL